MQDSGWERKESCSFESPFDSFGFEKKKRMKVDLLPGKRMTRRERERRRRRGSSWWASEGPFQIFLHPLPTEEREQKKKREKQRERRAMKKERSCSPLEVEKWWPFFLSLPYFKKFLKEKGIESWKRKIERKGKKEESGEPSTQWKKRCEELIRFVPSSFFSSTFLSFFTFLLFFPGSFNSSSPKEKNCKFSSPDLQSGPVRFTSPFLGFSFSLSLSLQLQTGPLWRKARGASIQRSIKRPFHKSLLLWSWFFPLLSILLSVSLSLSL